jgi:hypothetical protein
MRRHAFNQPVEPEALCLPGCLDVIKRPIDLETVFQHLKRGQYGLVRNQLLSVKLVKANTTRYNPPENPAHLAATKPSGASQSMSRGRFSPARSRTAAPPP